MTEPGSRAWGDLAFALGIVALGVFTLVDATSIVVPSGSASAVGPRGFPYLIGIALIGTGIAVTISAARGRRADPEAGEDVDITAKTDWLTVVKLGAFLVAHLLLLEIIGWPLACTLLFTGAAWSLGARSLPKAALIGLILGIVTYAGFALGLGISLPALPFWPAADEVLTGAEEFLHG